MACHTCGRRGYMASPDVMADLCLYELGSRRLMCRGCVVKAIDQALTVCVHGHPMTERCLACAVLRAGTQP